MLIIFLLIDLVLSDSYRDICCFKVHFIFTFQLLVKLTCNNSSKHFCI